MSLPSGSWMGSNVTSEDITQLRATRRLPRETDVGVRLPRSEQRPRPEGQERVVFLTHFERGLNSIYMCTDASINYTASS